MFQDIYSHNPNVTWDDIIGLDHAKRLVKESVVYPIKVVDIFYHLCVDYLESFGNTKFRLVV